MRPCKAGIAALAGIAAGIVFLPRSESIASDKAEKSKHRQSAKLSLSPPKAKAQRSHALSERQDQVLIDDHYYGLRKDAMSFRMPIKNPDPNIDYKIELIKPHPNFDYQILDDWPHYLDGFDAEKLETTPESPAAKRPSVGPTLPSDNRPW